MIDTICRKGLPIVLEETFETTKMFLERIRGRTPVIIPHLGLLNGGFQHLLTSGIWEDESVYADTALADPMDMRTFVDRYGPNRLLFGSDFPFGEPGEQLDRLRSLGLSDFEMEKICCENILRIIK